MEMVQTLDLGQSCFDEWGRWQDTIRLADIDNDNDLDIIGMVKHGSSAGRQSEFDNFLYILPAIHCFTYGQGNFVPCSFTLITEDVLSTFENMGGFGPRTFEVLPANEEEPFSLVFNCWCNTQHYRLPNAGSLTKPNFNASSMHAYESSRLPLIVQSRAFPFGRAFDFADVSKKTGQVDMLVSSGDRFLGYTIAPTNSFMKVEAHPVSASPFRSIEFISTTTSLLKFIDLDLDGNNDIIFFDYIGDSVTMRVYKNIGQRADTKFTRLSDPVDLLAGIDTEDLPAVSPNFVNIDSVSQPDWLVFSPAYESAFNFPFNRNTDGSEEPDQEFYAQNMNSVIHFSRTDAGVLERDDRNLFGAFRVIPNIPFNTSLERSHSGFAFGSLTGESSVSDAFYFQYGETVFGQDPDCGMCFPSGHKLANPPPEGFWELFQHDWMIEKGDYALYTFQYARNIGTAAHPQFETTHNPLASVIGSKIVHQLILEDMNADGLVDAVLYCIRTLTYLHLLITSWLFITTRAPHPPQCLSSPTDTLLSKAILRPLELYMPARRLPCVTLTTMETLTSLATLYMGTRHISISKMLAIHPLLHFCGDTS
jgi:hypothetical protein